jgi:hypothetical protein
MRFCLGLTLLLLTVVATPVVAQLDQLRMEIEQGYTGLDGYIRPGSWAPIRLSVDNLAADDREVLFRWELDDPDGDRVVAERRVTLTRQREGQPVWLYAPVPLDTQDQSQWTLRAIDADSQELLASMVRTPNADLLLRESETLIAVTSAGDLGLVDAARHDLSQAPIQLVRGLSLGRLPDRWHGLDALSALIWTQDLGDDPADPLQVSEAALSALRQWVYRGGHLVVVLPQVGQTWSQSPLADMLPVDGSRWRPVDTEDWYKIPTVGGLVRPGETGGGSSLTLTTFDVAADDPRATVLLRDTQRRPIVVAGRYGFGAVTLVGLDLTAEAVRRSGVNLGERRLWHEVFGWSFPILTRGGLERQVTEGRLYTAENLAEQNQFVELAGYIPGRIAMTGTVSTLLVGGIVLFGLYWLIAGWLLQPLMRRRGWARWTWVGFVGTVCGFAALAWGGAALLRPVETGLRHVTILDFDGNAGVARGRSFGSLLIPRFGTAEVATATPTLGGRLGQAVNLIASPGTQSEPTPGGFVDTQRYDLNAADPARFELPVRSTTKTLSIDYLGPVDGDLAGLREPFTVAATRPIEAGPDRWPVGEVRHTLPGTLTNVQIVYCPGEAFDASNRLRQLEPVIWRYVNDAGENRWDPDRPLRLTGRPGRYERLTPPFRRWREIDVERDWSSAEGFLGRRLGELSGPTANPPRQADDSVVVRELELLSFFDALPVPALKRDPESPALNRGFVLRRQLAPRMDLTPLLRGRRVIILGHLPEGPLPVPLAVDGEAPPSRGWTMVRWVYDF